MAILAARKQPKWGRKWDRKRLFVEQVDRLSRLNGADWDKLRADLKAKHVRVVALDLPTSWQMIKGDDEFTQRMAEAINGMMLDMLAAIARKDYTDRRRRQAQGIATAKTEGKYRGRPENTERNDAITKMLGGGQTWATVMKATGCSRCELSGGCPFGPDRGDWSYQASDSPEDPNEHP